MLGLPDFTLQLFDENGTVTISLLSLRHLLNLEEGEPVESLTDLISVEILIKVFVLRVVHLDQVNTTWLIGLVMILICIVARGRPLRHWFLKRLIRRLCCTEKRVNVSERWTNT